MNDTSQFDPAAFLDMTMDAPSVKRPPLPTGDYRAVVGDVTSKSWTSGDGSKSGINWEIPLAVDVPAELQSSLGLDKPTITLTDKIFLDLTPAGGLDNGPGKNGKIRRYREALDLNKPGDAFSARAMVGRIVLVRVGHRVYNGDLFEEVSGIARA